GAVGGGVTGVGDGQGVGVGAVALGEAGRRGGAGRVGDRGDGPLRTAGAAAGPGGGAACDCAPDGGGAGPGCATRQSDGGVGLTGDVPSTVGDSEVLDSAGVPGPAGR